MSYQEIHEELRRERENDTERRAAVTPSRLALKAAHQIYHDHRVYLSNEEMIEAHAAIIERALQQGKTDAEI